MAKIKLEIEIPDGHFCDDCIFFYEYDGMDNSCDFLEEPLRSSDVMGRYNFVKHPKCPHPTEGRVK